MTERPDPKRYMLPRTVPVSEIKATYSKHWWLIAFGMTLPITDVSARSSEVTNGVRLVAQGEKVRLEIHALPDQLIDVAEFDQPAYLVEKTARALADADGSTTIHTPWEKLQPEDRERWMRMAKAVAPADSSTWYDFPQPTILKAEPVKK